MAAKELESKSDQKLDRSFSNPNDLDRFVDTATDSLLFKHFEKCLEVCESGISAAKLQANSSEVVEKLCVIAIQAHAELDTWQQVLPFVLTVYGGIECCPQTIIQLCLLLHARVEDYAQCQALVSVWLRNSNNFSDPEYVDLAQAFIQHIMVPQKQVALIPAFLESCPGLSVNQKEDLNAHYADIMKAEVEQATIDRETERKEEQASKSKDIESDFFNFLRASGSALFRRFPPLSLHQVSKIAAVLMLLYLIGIKSTKDSKRTYSPLIVIWQGLHRILNGFVQFIN